MLSHTNSALALNFGRRNFKMQNIGAAWLYPIILIAGALQAWGPPMNNALRNSLENPWLASLGSQVSSPSCLSWRSSPAC
jgi:transporter family-2 protein